MTIQIGSDIGAYGFVNRRKATTISNGVSITTPANYASESALDARLTAISGTLFTAAYLAKLTMNDKIYELRYRDDLTTI